MSFKKGYRFHGMITGIVSVVLFILFRLAPGLAEILYGKGIYPVVRFGLDYTFGLLPFPVVYLLPLLLVFLIWRRIRAKATLRAHSMALANTFGWFVAMFYLLWGFNYARPTLNQRIDVPEERITEFQFIQLGEYTVQQMNLLRTEEIMKIILDEEILESDLRNAVEKAVNNYGFELATQCRVRTLAPPGVLRKLGITGIYFPYTGEGLVEASHPIPEKIFVIAHELAHGYGVTDEGEANLIAYIACSNHSNSLVKYSGHLALWEYLMYIYQRRELTDGVALKNNLKPQVLADLKRLQAEREKYKECIPRLGDVVNDTYLKTQGVEEGTDAYLTLPEQVIRHQALPYLSEE